MTPDIQELKKQADELHRQAEELERAERKAAQAAERDARIKAEEDKSIALITQNGPRMRSVVDDIAVRGVKFECYANARIVGERAAQAIENFGALEYRRQYGSTYLTLTYKPEIKRSNGLRYGYDRVVVA